MDALARLARSGDAVLFTGAGFSCDASDAGGAPVPDSRTMTRELWQLCFGETDEPDASTLADLYDVAMRCASDGLRAYVERRLRVGSPLPEYYRAWFGAPWRRIYTLNVDDLEDVAARQFDLRLPEVIHLNGKVGGGVEELTFSTLQYAARLASREKVYERLAADLAATPFVFVGTTLDEAVLWKHTDLSDHPRSYIITPHLPRARIELLAALGIEWIAGTAEEAAGWLSATTPAPTATR